MCQPWRRDLNRGSSVHYSAVKITREMEYHADTPKAEKKILSYVWTLLLKCNKTDRPWRRQSNTNSWKLLQVFKLRIIYSHKPASPFVSGWMTSRTGPGICLYETLPRFWSQLLIIHQQEEEKTSLCVWRFFLSSFVSCKTQHCVIEFGKIGPRGMEVATGLI